MDIAELPTDFRSLLSVAPAGFTLSDRVVEPVIVLSRIEGRIRAVLAGRRFSRGQASLFAAPSVRHAWVVDGDIIRPLPSDIPELVLRVFEGGNPEDLPYATAVGLILNPPDFVAVEADARVLESAKDAAEGVPEAMPIEGLEATLFPYQSRGVRWMRDTAERSGGLVLADEMGLGKTLQIIALLMARPPDTASPALVVCPTTLIANWVREFTRFAPSLSVMVHRGPDRTGYFRDLQVARVVITSYDTLVQDVGMFSSLEWGWLICDEAQAVKNPDSNRRQALASLPRKRTIPITGTPVENGLLDLWSLADLAIPGLLGDRISFRGRFPDTVEAGKRLGSLTDPIILRRRVADVAGDLPERIDIDLPLEMDGDLAIHYDAVLETTKARYPVASALVATLHLQLFCAHPWLSRSVAETDPWEDAGVDAASDLPRLTPKIVRVTELLREAFLNGRKVIIFALFNRIGDLIRMASRDLSGTWWGAINGATPQELRQEIVDEFSAQAGPACLILNPKAAGAGLNITAATVVIHFTPVWNPATEAQASARAHRRGQTEPVTIYRLYYKDTVEEVMVDRSAWKAELADETVPVSSRDAEDLKRALRLSPTRPRS